MAACRACQHELDAAALAAGACPACGARLATVARRRIEDRTTRTLDQEEVPPGSEGSIDIELTEATHAGDPVLPPAPGPGAPPKRPTVRGGETIEFTPGSDPSGGADDGANEGADDGASGGAEAQGPAANPPTPPGKRSTHSFDGDRTIDLSSPPGGPGDDLVARMTREWGSAIVPDSRERHTLRQGETVQSSTRRSHSAPPVKSRSVRQIKPGGATGPFIADADAPDYELLEMIGQGGMGVVYAARQSSIARTVAIKMLKPGQVREEQRDKFISEAVVTGDLDHPNIVPIYDLGANDEGALFYSMKRVKGTPWDQVLSTRPLDENLNTLMRVADAVAFAHAEGVVHRDLKPENVMLGDFGEVLVMDWGLARVTSAFRNASAVYQADSLGGTPAYMAPEMARGPIERIDARSDVYLLGAILYEVITGGPPHSGRDVMQCLMAAANNKIDPTDYQGELLGIALKAMATEQQDRYPSVKAFQQAVRDYQSHSESLVLAGNAQAHLATAEETGDYQSYARALYGCQEALTLWDRNDRASRLLESTRVAYASAALNKGDFDLGISLLDAQVEQHRPLLERLTAGRAERDARQRRVRNLKRVAVGLAAAFIVGATGAFFAIRAEKNRAIAEKIKAVEAEGVAVAQRELAERAKREADAARVEEERQRVEAQRQEGIAVENERAAVKARQEAVEAERVAVAQREEARRQEAEAKRQEALATAAKESEEYEAYVAQIGLAAAKIDENAFDSARDLLTACEPRFRRWEWGRLSYLCGLNPVQLDYKAPVDAVAYSPDGAWLVTGAWDGTVEARDASSGDPRFRVKLAQYVHSVACSPDGKRVAAGASDGVVYLLDARDGSRLGALRGHAEGVLSVQYAPDGKRLLTAGYDNTARLWDTATGRELQKLEGHTWWVWTARFGPGGDRIVTASQDGRAVVWRSDDGVYKQETEFAEHGGPAYAAAFSPDGETVASAGYDGRVYLWRPEDVRPVSLKERLDGAELQAPPSRVVAGHDAPVRDVAFSPDGARLLTASFDNSVRLWDARAAEPIKTLRGHGSRARACVFAPEGRWAASAGQDQTVRLWDLEGYSEARVLRGRVLEGHDDAVLSAAYSADGSRVITASRDRTAKVWDPRSGEATAALSEGHEFLVTAVTLLDNGRRLATAAGDNSVRVWDATAGGELRALTPTGRTGALAAAADADWIVTGGNGNEARVWLVATGAHQRLLAHQDLVTAAAVSPAGDVIATGDQRGVIHLWRREGRAWRHGEPLRGHSRTIVALEFAGPGRLVSASADNTCGQWDVATGRELLDRVLKHPDRVQAMDVSADGRLCLTVCDDGLARLWRLDDASVAATHDGGKTVYTAASLSSDGATALLTDSARRRVLAWRPDAAADPETVIDLERHGGLLWAARFGQSDRQAITVGGNDARAWDLATGKPVLRFSPHGAVASAAISPDGRLAATASWDNSVKVWDLATGNVVRRLEGHTGGVNSVAFHPTSAGELLTASDDGTARLWTLAGGAPRVLRGHTARVAAARYSADGARVLTVSGDKTARLWDAATARAQRTLQGASWGLLAGDFSRDGRLVATAGQDNVARVYDAATGRLLLTLSGHTAGITGVAFTPDSARLLTGSNDRTAKLWDARTGKEVLTLAGHDAEVTGVAFSPDGRAALTSGRDGRAVVWPAVEWGPAAEGTAAR